MQELLKRPDRIDGRNPVVRNRISWAGSAMLDFTDMPHIAFGQAIARTQGKNRDLKAGWILPTPSWQQP